MLRKLTVTLVVCLGLFVFLAPAHADLIAWTTPDVVDASGDAFPGQDIIAAYHEFDGTYHYFRIDLSGAPQTGFLSNGFSENYGIYINSEPGGASGLVNTGYLPSTLSGIDYIVDSHFDPNMNQGVGDFYQHDYHDWNGTIFVATTPAATDQNGTVLEWKISAADLGTEFTWWAATHDPGFLPENAYDITTAVDTVVPIPASAWLFASGLVGLMGWRKRT